MQKKILVLTAPGFEELELLTPVALWRRAGFQALLASVSDSLNITGQQGITIHTDTLLSATEIQKFDMLYVPGGRGYSYIMESQSAMNTIKYFVFHMKPIAAICAGPIILAQAGYLNGKKAVCYPSMKDQLRGAIWTDQKVVYDPPFLTGKGAGASEKLAFKAIEVLDNLNVVSHLKQTAIFD